MNTNPTRQRIAIFGMFGAGNLGNECTLVAMLHNLRQYLPTPEICCVCAGPGEVASMYNISAFSVREGRLPRMNHTVMRFLTKIFMGIPLELYRWFKVIDKLKANDMLVMAGTGMLSDLGITPFGLHYDILRWSIAAKLCRCKLLFVSVGVGPIRHPVSRVFVKAALGLANYRSYRDNFSKNYLESIGFKREEDRVYPDLAFSLPKTMMLALPERGRRQNVVGVGLIAHSRLRATSRNDESVYQDYIAKVAAFVGCLLRREYTVRILVGDIAYDRRARQDLKALLERDGLKYERGRIVDEPPQSVRELLSQLATADFVIASRFHNVLLALMLGKPVVAISFHEKVDSLMDALSLKEFCQDIENIDLGKLNAQFDAMEQNAERLKLQIQQKTEEHRRRLDQQYLDILKACKIHTLVTS